MFLALFNVSVPRRIQPGGVSCPEGRLLRLGAVSILHPCPLERVAPCPGSRRHGVPMVSRARCRGNGKGDVWLSRCRIVGVNARVFAVKGFVEKVQNEDGGFGCGWGRAGSNSWNHGAV